ncbi:MAG: hypothetical protein KGJ86_00505 [Chloroflexota bacterium]|nr:hypothetical protein [Chloroflexota bacterium]
MARDEDANPTIRRGDDTVREMSTQRPRVIALLRDDGSTVPVPEHVAPVLAFLAAESDRLRAKFCEVRFVRQNGRWRPHIAESFADL